MIAPCAGRVDAAGTECGRHRTTAVLRTQDRGIGSKSRHKRNRSRDCWISIAAGQMYRCICMA
jgi:hypothetical protein